MKLEWAQIMKKWVGPLLAFFLVVVFFLLYSPFHIFKQEVPKEGSVKEPQIVQTQDTEKGKKKEEEDSHFIQILKQLREKLDGWLKSLNERIESEEVTRLEVRFLEILRNILEWMREKIDSKIESSKEKESKEEGGRFRETHLKYLIAS